nr:G-type lectin S-receptor-like serine/threonine-protein kinase LECRK3 [Tanacetum cinerariifolium]
RNSQFLELVGTRKQIHQKAKAMVWHPLLLLAAQRTNGSISVGTSLTASPDATPWLSPSGEFAFGFRQVQGNENFLLSICLAAQRTNGSISVGTSLTASPDATPWLSPSGEFAFGFRQVQGNENFLLSIWYDKIPDKTIVWYPRNGPMVVQGSKVELTNGLGLVLSDPRGRQVWNSGSISDLAYGAMNDTGNFMLVGSDSRNKWESFNFPADTILPTQSMPRNGVIRSKMSETNFNGGRFQLRLLEDGRLVLNSVDLLFGSAGNIYYSTDTEDDSNSTNSGSDYASMNPSNKEDCTTSCLKDCFCAVAIYRDNQCWKKRLPLANGETDISLNVKAFVKFRKGTPP